MNHSSATVTLLTGLNWRKKGNGISTGEGNAFWQVIWNYSKLNVMAIPDSVWSYTINKSSEGTMRGRSGDQITRLNCPIRRHMVLTVQISVEDIDLHVEKGLNTRMHTHTRTHARTHTHTLSLFLHIYIYTWKNAVNNQRITDCKIMKQTDLSCILSSLWDWTIANIYTTYCRN